jgi:WD40 repeat protein
MPNVMQPSAASKRGKADDAKPAVPQSDLLQTTFKGHTGDITCAVISPNGKYLATTSEDRTVRIFHKDS